MSPELINALIGSGATAVATTAGFLLSRWISRRDKLQEKVEQSDSKHLTRMEKKIDILCSRADILREDVAAIREDLGKTKMIADAIWRSIDDIKKEQIRIHERQDRLQERI